MATDHPGSCVGACRLPETKSFETALISLRSENTRHRSRTHSFSFFVHHCYWNISYVWRPTSPEAVVADNSQNSFGRLLQPSANAFLRAGFAEMPFVSVIYAEMLYRKPKRSAFILSSRELRCKRLPLAQILATASVFRFSGVVAACFVWGTIFWL